MLTDDTFKLTDSLREMAALASQRFGSAPCMRNENQTYAFFELYKDLPLALRQAKSFAYAMVNEPVLVFPHERIHGMFYIGADPQFYCEKAWDDCSVYPIAQKRVANEIPEITEIETPGLGYFTNEPGQKTFILSDAAIPGHIAWNYDLLLSLGAEGLIEKHRAAMQASNDPKAREYYECVIICLEGMLAWNRKHVEALKKLLPEATSDTQRKKILESIEVMEQVPAKPARNFYEAMQSFYFQWSSVIYEAPCGGNSPGRMDYFLWPYMKKDYEAGRLTYQQAGELLAEVFIKLDERVHPYDGYVHTIVIGGITPDKKDGVTPLTYLMLDVSEQLDLTHPAVYTRISNVNPQKYVDRCIDYMLHGKNRAQILADEPIITAMMRDGRMPFEDACMYICGGCMELNPHGMNSDLLFSFIYNVPKTLELLVTGGECLRNGQKRQNMKHSLKDFKTFEDFYAAFMDEVRYVLSLKFHQLDIYCETMAKYRPMFLCSSMISDCLERGRCEHDGGARYADYGGTPMGIQNAADMLTGIKHAVFDKHFCTADELVKALKADFRGYEKLQLQLKAVPKYGMGDTEADAMMNRTLASICEILDSHTTVHGGKVKPVILTFMWAATMGNNIGASPDGRNAGQPIAHGLTPQGTGFVNGVTQSINSYCSLDNTLVSGGASTMWDMDSSWIQHDILKSLVVTFMKNGGQIFQGNMTSVKELEKAFEKPEDYPNLIVRVGGFSSRFMSLPKDVQMEIITRYRHCG